MPALDIKSAGIPNGLRVYAIGDVHGRLDLLRTLMEMIAAYEEMSKRAKSILIFLGDYIDRGPDSRGVIDFLANHLAKACRTVFLRGNHEQMLLQIFEDRDGLDIWLDNGGLQTAHSYGIDFDPHNHTAADAEFMVYQLDAALPSSHRSFLENSRFSFEIGDYFFTHAGVRPNVRLEQQLPMDLLFIREPFLSFRGDHGRIVVHGHTPVERPQIMRNRIAIDTGAFFTGQLTALCLEGQSRTFLTTGDD